MFAIMNYYFSQPEINIIWIQYTPPFNSNNEIRICEYLEIEVKNNNGYCKDYNNKESIVYE